jgi:hypothetical protein
VTVEKFYDAFISREALASVRLDGETWSLPRFQIDQPVWAAGRPATVVLYVPEGEKPCGAHPGEYRYQVRFEGTGENWTPWPYCESQLTERN